MRTVHETEALRPSDPVPKHHSSNPSNKFQRIKLVLSEEKRAGEKASTPASPSSHAPNSATLPPATETDPANDNIKYIQNPVTNETEVEFPPDIQFSEDERVLPADKLFRLLRHQLQWATQEGEKLRVESDKLEKQRKEEWVSKELLMENMMESELATAKRRRLDSGETEEPEYFALLEEDVVPSKKLQIQPRAEKLPWWREDGWQRGPDEGKDEAERVDETSLTTS